MATLPAECAACRSSLPPKPPPLQITAPNSKSGTVTFDVPSDDDKTPKVATFGAMVQEGMVTPTSRVFKSFVSTASGHFLSVVGQRSSTVLLPEGVERSHTQHTAGPSSWNRFDSPGGRTWDSASTLGTTPQGDPLEEYPDGFWSRVDRPACAILAAVGVLGLTCAIGLKEHQEALARARAPRPEARCVTTAQPPALPTFRPNPQGHLVWYRLDVPVEYAPPGGSGSVAATAHEHSASRFCQRLASGATAAGRLQQLRSELGLWGPGAAIPCWPDPVGGGPPSLRPPASLPEECAPPSLVPGGAAAGVFLLVGGIPLTLWALARCFFKLSKEPVDEAESET